ncbi:hypothetical protein TNCT_129101 [Trichonephila clavata]|uniref:Glycine-rich protein n=1 Tax=Trichonephila clavata TaxID=2740835 RepID=A0A8X6G4Y5_TRICU|nr:hypothetical protein TNCT_129101 [Trichonephila clavata]
MNPLLQNLHTIIYIALFLVLLTPDAEGQNNGRGFGNPGRGFGNPGPMEQTNECKYLLIYFLSNNLSILYI